MECTKKNCRFIKRPFTPQYPSFNCSLLAYQSTDDSGQLFHAGLLQENLKQTLY